MAQGSKIEIKGHSLSPWATKELACNEVTSRTFGPGLSTLYVWAWEVGPCAGQAGAQGARHPDPSLRCPHPLRQRVRLDACLPGWLLHGVACQMGSPRTLPVVEGSPVAGAAPGAWQPDAAIKA